MANNREQVKKVYDYSSNKRNPYKNIKMSLICSCRSTIERLTTCLESFAKTCSSIDEVEVLIKFDSDLPIDPYLNILMDCPFRFKIMAYPRFHGYWDQHLFANDLVKIASGDLIWHIGDDMRITSGDWFKWFMSTRDKYFKDNIYVVNVGERPRREKSNPFSLVTKEWISFFGYWSLVSNSDSYLSRVARGIGRYVEPDFPVMMEHDGPHGFMANDKVTSLEEKRAHTKKLINQAIKYFNERKKK